MQEKTKENKSTSSIVAVAMSGGVDSSVTAALMVEEYGSENVFGLTMKLFCYGETEAGEKACCSNDAVNDARRVCEQLGIAHYVIDLEKEFAEAVIGNFVAEYEKGHTPIPCVICNTVVKFDYLAKKAMQLGADMLATGHYAQIKKVNGGYQLLRGTDRTKDQSYFLYGLTQEQLAHTLFPIGDIAKTETRRIAAKLGLKTAEKKESQGICFVVGERVTDYLTRKIKTVPGEIINTDGEVVGSHEGIIYYTRGQRKRIGGGYKEAMYVVDIDPEKNQVIIGTEKDLYQKSLTYHDPNWILSPSFPFSCTAKIRYNMEDEICRVDNSTVTFDEGQRAITPGQSVVFYDGEIVLGGALITGKTIDK